MRSKKLLSVSLVAVATSLLLSGFAIIVGMAWTLSCASFINIPVLKITLSGLRGLALITLWAATVPATLGTFGITRTGEERLWKGAYLLFPVIALWGTILAVFFT